VVVELINTGSELMLGRVLNTHQQWLCRQLADMGAVVSRQTAVPDTGEAIVEAVRESLSRADLVITTGGLGPTSDDVTRDLVARLLGRSLREDPIICENIRAFFRSRNRPMPESTRVQAMVPEGASVLPNPNGTAPGLAIELAPNPFRAEGAKAWLIMLPGPPRELRPMFVASAAPLIRKEWPGLRFLCRTLRSVGIGESVVEEKVSPLLQPLVKNGLELGYCARTGEVDVRIAAHGPDADRIVQEAERIVRGQLQNYIYGLDEEDLETIVIRGLGARKETLALAESCTGGLIGHLITNVPGASAVLMAGIVSYSNDSKIGLLGVDRKLIEAEGAVSEACCAQMAEGARKVSGATWSIAVTGIAGPSGGTPEKPVGTVFIGVAGPSGTVIQRRFNPFERETFKQATAHQALDLLRRKALCPNG
jgi:nicotinamide-nucleotide amidase